MYMWSINLIQPPGRLNTGLLAKIQLQSTCASTEQMAIKWSADVVVFVSDTANVQVNTHLSD